VPSDLCDICGNGVETGHHAMITCTKARALWQEMRKEWQLPDDEQLRETRPDWLPLLLGRLDRHKKMKTLLLMWRQWFLMNNMVFGSGQESIIGSAKFLASYWESLCGIGRRRCADEDGKGKALCSMHLAQREGGVYRQGRMRTRNDGNRHRKDGSKSTWMRVYVRRMGWLAQA
jgi:hypothetical protein